jgi:alpha-pyrone synthase
MGKAKICSIGTSVPDYRVSQKNYLNYYLGTNSVGPAVERLVKTVCYKSGIKERYSVLADFSEDANPLYYDNVVERNGLEKKMRIYEEKALNLSKKAVEDCLSYQPQAKDKISHLVTFSCTGMYAPGIDVGIVEAFNLAKDVERTCINFMGCYAAIVALKNAYHIVRSNPQAVVLLVGVELCSIHHNTRPDPEQVVANAIFGDGASAVLVTSEDPGFETGRGLELVNFYSLFAPDGKNDMTWRIGNNAFELYLSSYVPKLLDKDLKSIAGQLLLKSNVKNEDIDFYAIHPGGMAILKACENALGISEEQNRFSYKVLQEFGNMSSVTVLFVLKELFKSLKDEDAGKNVLSFAFGPGLTMESMLLKVI